MKKTNNKNGKKRGGIVISLVAATSLVIFSLILISLVVNLGRGGRIADSSLDDLQEVIQRVKSSPNAIETTEVFIGPESAIIGYAPHTRRLITKFEAKRIETRSIPIIGWSYSLGEKYTFPEPNGDLEGTFQHDERATFQGYIKERPANCPLEHFCICECINVDLETRELSEYVSHNAFLRCADEQCRIVRDIELPRIIYLKDFMPHKEEYQNQEDEEIRPYPDPNTFFWEGGFIFLRSQKFNLGRKTFLCVDRGLSFFYYRFDDCKGEIIKDREIMKSKRSVAGFTYDYVADFFDLRIINAGSNRVTFEVYG